MNNINIIMGTYQGEKYLAEQIDSLLESDYQEFKLFIFDDCSTDATVITAREYEDKYPGKINVIENNKNYGHVYNFIHGLIKASTLAVQQQQQGDYYMFCDQDDVWHANKMHLMLKRMKQLEYKFGNDCPLLVFSDALITDEKLNIKNNSYHKSQKLNVQKRDLPHLLMENKCSGCMMMINDVLVQKVRRLPKHARYHDWWLALIAAAFGHISYINTPTIMYRQHGSNVVGNQGSFNYILDRLRKPFHQKEALLASQLQAGEFLMTYKEELDSETADIIKNFAYLSEDSWLERRIKLFRYGYFKSSFIRNLGLLLLI